jgi:dolichyl-diphosphooligosaccharide--protein glycosyltransferase
MQDAVTDWVNSLRESEPSGLLKRIYHAPVLLVLMAFMLVVRLRALENFQTNESITFRGNDPWYHFRETTYLLDNFPSTMPFDPWTNYPSGTSADQFGTLFDQLVSGFILFTTFGDPSAEYATLIMLVAAPVLLVLTVIPAYLIASHFAGRGPALAGIAVFALLPGTVLNYTLVGFFDHHAAEVLFQTLAVLAFIGALSVAQRDQPIWELVVDRDFEALRTPLLYSVGAGVAAALYMWSWPPGVLLVGFTGIYFAIKLTSDVYHNQSPEPIAFVGAVSMTATGLLMLVPLNRFSIAGSASYSLLQVVLPLAVSLGCVFLAFLARQWEARDLSASQYPFAVGGILVVLFGIFSLAVPNIVRFITNQLLNTVGFSANAGTRTIGEAQPFLSQGSPFAIIYSEYGLAFFAALAAALIILGRPLIKSDDTNDTIYVVGSLATVGLIYLATPVLDSIAGVIGQEWQVLGLIIATGLLVGTTLRYRYDAAELYALVWAAFITSAAFTQVRFNYYLAVVVAVFSAIFVAQIVDAVDISVTGESLRESVQSLEGWQIMTAVAVVLVLTVPLLVPVAGSAWATAENNGPGAVTQWEDSLEWMNSETPYPGELEGADNPMEYYGTYERPADGDFEYPEGAYGVQSWWDYGHWITVNGERIPNANPFQQGASEAANYLLAPSEQRAAEALGEKMGDNDETRYVMVDWEMVMPNAKFGAPIVFYDDEDVSQSDFVEGAYPIIQTDEGQQYGQPVTLRNQRYYDSQMVRLYNNHGSAVDPKPIVIETEPRTITAQGQELTINTFDPNSDIQTFDTLSEAEAYVEETPGARLGGLGSNPTERVDALEHYRLVKASESNALNSRGYQQELGQTAQVTNLTANQLLQTNPHWVKTFERVPGATVEGTGAAPDQEVSATVEMQIPETSRNFTYTQHATADENGNFEMTLPYSTTGYDEFGPENGYTNTSVQATGNYTFTTDPAAGNNSTFTQLTGQAVVDEAQVVGQDDSPVTVELSEQTIDLAPTQPAESE